MAAKKWPTFKQGQQAAGKGGMSKGLCWAHQKHGEDCTDVATRRTAPGWETRWPGGSGSRLLWPQRPTSPVVGRGITAVVPGRHKQLLLHHTSQVQRATIWAAVADVALPIVRAHFLRHFGLLVDLGEMRILAKSFGWSQHLVQPSGSVMFATTCVVAYQPLQIQAEKKNRHLGVV